MPAAAPGAPGFRTLRDLEAAAGAALAPGIWDYIQGGSGDERTLAANRAAFVARSLRPSALVDVAVIDPKTTLLGHPVAAPFFIAPTAYHGSIHPEGERATAAAAAAEGVLAAFSTLSTVPLEEIAAANGVGPRWFQLYLQPEERRSRELVERAHRAGYAAIVLTVDVPILAVRDRQAREGFALEAPVALGNGPDFVSPPRAPSADGPIFRLGPPASSDWSIVERIGEWTPLPVVVKGVLSAEDARRAVDHGARGIVVSNHGGRQLDGAPASLDVLPEIVHAVGGQVEVYLDGGVRRGTDVLIALALGARAVGIGRPVLWALGAGGAAGVRRYLGLLRDELVNQMALAGRPSVPGIGPDLVRPAAR